MYIKFDIKCLRDRIKILRIFNPYGTLWCDGKKCEIIITSEVKVCIEVPFIATDITELIAFNIHYDKIGELTLKNSISDVITIIFKETGITTEEVKIENNVFFLNPEDTKINSISHIPGITRVNDNDFTVVKNVDIEPKLDETSSFVSKKLKAIKHVSGYLTIQYMAFDSFKYSNENNNFKYRLDPSEYNDIAYIFKIDMTVLTNFIKKIVATKSSTIEIQFFENHVKLSALRNDNIKNSIIDESTFYFSILHSYKHINNKYKLPLELFRKLKNLNISISDFIAKDKKIYNSIQFNVVTKHDAVNGLCIYPGTIGEENKEEIKKYFVFIPIYEY
jgi:hypothetical protein